MPTLPMLSGELSGTRHSIELATSVSPTAVPVRKPRRFDAPPSIDFRYGGGGRSASPRQGRSGFDAADGAARDVLRELRSGSLVAAPRQWKRYLAAAAERTGTRDASPIGHAITIFKFQDWQKHQAEAMVANHPRRRAG